MTDPVVLESAAPPPRTPFAARELHAARTLLEANGYQAGAAGWRDALGSPHAALRTAAYQLLADAPVAEDAARFERGLTDSDRAARAWAAFGIEQLRPGAGRDALRALAAEPVEFGEYGPLVAAVALARLGDGSAFETIVRADATLDARVAVVRQLFWFGRLGIDEVWPLYERAIADDTPGVRELALLQLRELDAPGARALLAGARATP